MNKKQIVASLNNIANELDNSGLYAEASTVTKVMSRLAYDDDDAEPVQKSNLQRHIEMFEKKVKRILDKYPNSIEKQLIEIKNEKAYTLDDMRREDRPEFEILVDKMLEKIRDERKASTVTKVMSRLASDMDIVQERNLSGLVGDTLDPERKRGDLFGDYMSNNKNKVIDALAEAIQDMEDDPMISDAEIDKVRQIMDELKNILS